jgi:hypothetical protein
MIPALLAWPFFDREVSVGAPVRAFVVFIGAANSDLLYLMSDFNASEQAPPKPPPLKPD